ncbi:MAG: hypothetical protein K9M17_07965 [Mariprofundaceae bacterium]|nr:hypothetical protein [Mariprofundaceae bacterium]
MPSPKKWADTAVGLTVDELLAPASAKRTAKQYINEDGKKVIVIPSYPTCSIHYILDENGVVESYRLIGEDCR